MPLGVGRTRGLFTLVVGVTSGPPLRDATLQPSTHHEVDRVDQTDVDGGEGAPRETTAGTIPPRIRNSVLKALSLAWVPLSASLLSLILSVASIVVATREPEVLLILPDMVRVSQGRESGSAYVYLQPAYVSTGANDRVEVIRGQELLVVTPSGQEISFPWDEQGRLVGNDSTGELDYQYLADPAPLLVSPRTAASPVCLFDAPAGWYFEPGTYRFSVVADRVVAPEALVATFQVTIRPEDLAVLDAPGPDRFLAFALE